MARIDNYQYVSGQRVLKLTCINESSSVLLVNLRNLHVSIALERSNL